jgi:CCR4-NOT transcription complex subunit 9
MSALLQEIVSVYPLLAPSGLTAHASNRVCNALALLQCVASHPETRGMFLNGTNCFLYFLLESALQMSFMSVTRLVHT